MARIFIAKLNTNPAEKPLYYQLIGNKRPERVFNRTDHRSLTFWGCTGFDGLSTIAGCMPRLTDESR